MWTQQSLLWLSHQQSLHNPPIPTQDPVALQELRLEIQYLHGLKGQVLAQHRDTYFHKNLNHFLQTSTVSQLRTYITNFKPAIYQSIARAKQNASQSKKITNYPGFQLTGQTKGGHCPTHTVTTTPLPDMHPTGHVQRRNLYQPTILELRQTPTSAEPANPYLPLRPHPRHTCWKMPSFSASQKPAKPNGI